MPEIWELVQGGKPLSQSELGHAATSLLARFGNLKIWLFYGEMGAGKTTFIKVIAEKLGVNTGMNSPTFPLINEYRTVSGSMVYHFDFYRIKKEQEAFDIGTEEYFDSGGYCLVEWPEKIPSLIPEKRLEIKITAGTDPAHRILQYAAHD